MPHRTLAVPLAATLALGIAAVPAGAIGLPDVPVPSAVSKCVAAKGRLCIPLTGSAAAASGGLASLTTSSSRRRGLGLPPARRLFGRRAGRLLKKSDRQFAASLAGPLKEPKVRAADAAKIRRALSASRSVRSGQSVHARSLKLAMQVDACPSTPVPPGGGPSGNSRGRIAIEGRGRYTVTDIARYGRRYVVDVVEMTFDVDQSGLVNHKAFYDGSLSEPPNRLRISRSRATYDTRTHSTHGEVNSNFDVLVHGIDPVVKVEYRRASFDGWIEREIARERGDPDPDADAALAGKSYLDTAGRFAKWVARRLLDVVREAEANWRTPNRCVKLDLDGPSELAPGGLAQVHGNLTPVGGTGVKEGLYGAYVWFDGDLINGGSARTLATLPLDQAETWFEYTAPSSPWADDARPGMDITATTKGGIGRATITFKLVDKLYFRLVGYNAHQQSVTAYGTHDIQDVITGGPGPVTTFDPCSGSAPCVPYFQLDGQVQTTGDGKVKGTPNPMLCPGGEFTYGTFTLTNPLHVLINYDPRTTAPATYSTSMIPEVGDIFIDYCGAHDFAEATNPVTASVAREELLSGRPVAFTFGGSGSESSAGNHPGTPIQWSLTGTATVQRVNEDGSALAGA